MTISGAFFSAIFRFEKESFARRGNFLLNLQVTRMVAPCY
jgi:hypothetical protein